MSSSSSGRHSRRGGVIRKTPGSIGRGWNDAGPHLAPRGASPIVLDASAVHQTPARSSTKKPWFGTPTSLASSTTASASSFLQSTPASRTGNNNSTHLPQHIAYYSEPSFPPTASTLGNSYQHHHIQALSAADPSAAETTTSAASWARAAPHAGYLEKLGSRVPAFKRRFFVLQPGTHLYYFLSPHDTSPRGCLDLQDSWVEPLAVDDKDNEAKREDEPYRFAICWEGNRRIVLEARSKQAADDWMKVLKAERLDLVRQDLQKSKLQNSALKSRVRELEQEVADLRMVEKDRDGAIEDAARWRAEFERLDEALRRLTLHMVQKTPKHVSPDRTNNNKDKKNDESDDDRDVHSQNTTEASTEDDDDESENGARSNDRDASLLDEVVKQEERLDVFNVPGTFFSGLYNTCEQLKENLRLASDEVTTTITDLHAANNKVNTLEKRMGKAEKQLAKFWEENCSVRKALKQKKREKRVLVREVKNLLQAAKRADETPLRGDIVVPADDASASSCVMESDEEKLMEELEGHVISSIRLHEQLLAASGTPIQPRSSQSLSRDPPLIPDTVTSTTRPEGSTIRFEQLPAERPSTTRRAHAVQTALQSGKTLVSLFDESSDDDNDDAEEDDEKSTSEQVNVGDSDDGRGSDKLNLSTESVESPERPNPILQLDEDDSVQEEKSDTKETPRTVIEGNATSKLTCPLADVHKSRTGMGGSPNSRDLQVYHLTFYSGKIGIQFQKVPPPPLQPKGLLTEALTADLNGDDNDGGDKTAEELKRIAAFSTFSSPMAANSKKQEICPIATPTDAVLVCGFQGFDDSSSNIRPKLGARLVAFDGVSVEIGNWTFDSIRKAIKARSRPLTLSFRNDFLTTEQRKILTKAINDVDPPHAPTPFQPSLDRTPTGEPSVYSTLSHESDRFVNGARHSGDSITTDPDSWSVSVGRSDASSSAMRQSFSAARSLASTGRRSFSEAGSSASVLSAVAPLVANLLKRNSVCTPPEYMRRDPTPVEETPQHQDFQSELL